jgi:N-acylneuraminate cytidylyltransferase|tara:strand:+ start:994 stop:1683 length:690 start_codon:yes stop_codon:yes gene_type:complete
MKITAIVPVKGNSQRVKKKNLRKFSNTSLYELKLDHLKKTNCFDKIIISSEDDYILEMAKNKKFLTHKRKKYYSTSHVPMSEVYSNIASEVEGDYIAWINVTNPLCDHHVYEHAIKKFKSLNKKKFDCLLSAITHKQNFFYRNKPVNFKRTPWPSSQNLEPLITLPFAISIVKRIDLIKWRSLVGKKPSFLYLNPIIALDIDNSDDFKLAEIIFKQNKFGLKKKDYFVK